MTNNAEFQTLLATPETEKIPAAPEFKLDVPVVEVDIDVSSDPKVVKVVSARMSRPAKEQIVKQEAMSLTEIVEANATEDDIVVDQDRANAYLFDEIALKVKGFRLPGEDPSVVKEFRDVNDELLSRIPSTYKSAFVKGMYNVTAKHFEDGEEGVLLSVDETIPVDLFVGDEESPIAKVRFEVPEPTETERKNYASSAVKLRQPKGSRKSRNRIVTDINASVRFFDTLMERPGAEIFGQEGTRVTISGKTFAESASGIARKLFIDGIDPVYKQKVIAAAMSKYNAKVQD